MRRVFENGDMAVEVIGCFSAGANGCAAYESEDLYPSPVQRNTLATILIIWPSHRISLRFLPNQQWSDYPLKDASRRLQRRNLLLSWPVTKKALSTPAPS